jgi:hypothetical protein
MFPTPPKRFGKISPGFDLLGTIARAQQRLAFRVDAEHTRRMNRQTYRRQECENRNERPPR